MLSSIFMNMVQVKMLGKHMTIFYDKILEDGKFGISRPRCICASPSDMGPLGYWSSFNLIADTSVKCWES